jgi:hypothetical protein
LAAILVLSLLPPAEANQPSPRIELLHAVTAARIAAQTQPTSREVLRLRLTARGGSHVTPCRFDDNPSFECFQFDWGTVYLPPYPLALPGTQPKIPGLGNTAVYEWVSADQVQDGARIFESWRHSVGSGIPTSCSGATCSLLVEAIASEQEKNEVSYAVCKVIRINGQFGAPEECQQVAVKLENDVWLYAVTGSNYSAPSLGRPDFSLRLRAGPPQYAPPSKASLSKVLADGLRSPPLSYEVQASEDFVQAIASYRVSPLLKNNWRETVTVTIALRDLNDNPRGIGLTLATTFLVNRQNSGREDYHPADPVQETQLLEQIRKIVDRATADVCKQVIPIANDEVSCGQQ